MDKYERYAKRHAEQNGHVIQKGRKGLYVFEKDGRWELDDEPDHIFEDYRDYTRHYIGKELRKKHLRKGLRIGTPIRLD